MLIRAIRIIRVLKNSSSCFKEHESNESTECRLNIKQETQAAEPSVLIRAIRIIRVLKKIAVRVLKNTNRTNQPNVD